MEIRVGQTFEIQSPWLDAYRSLRRNVIYQSTYQSIFLGNAREICDYIGYSDRKYGVLFLDSFGNDNKCYNWISDGDLNENTLVCSNEVRGKKIIIKNFTIIDNHFGIDSHYYFGKLKLEIMRMETS